MSIRTSFWASLVWTLCAFAWSAQPETLGIEHDRVACVVAGEFPFVRAQAAGSSAAHVESARVYFKASRESEWYYLEMTALDGETFHAALPKPLPDVGKVDYYVSMVRSDFDELRTEDLDFDVLEGGCTARRAPAGLAAGLILRGTAANQAPIPLGFSADAIESFVSSSGQVVSRSGLTGATVGGGISTATLGIIGGGAAAAGVGIAVASGGGDEPRATTLPTAMSPMATTPAPTPTPAQPTNPFSGNWDVTDTVRESCEASEVGAMRTTRATFTQNGSMLTIVLMGPSVTGTLTGTVTGSAFTAMGQVVDADAPATTRVTGSIDAAGNAVSGTFEEFFPEDECDVTGVFSGVRR